MGLFAGEEGGFGVEGDFAELEMKVSKIDRGNEREWSSSGSKTITM